jgi:hypothetical protein
MPIPKNLRQGERNPFNVAQRFGELQEQIVTPLRQIEVEIAKAFGA